MSAPRIIRVDPRHSRANLPHFRSSPVPDRTPNAEVPVGTLRDVPNAITAARLMVSVACFAAMGVGAYAVALVLFLVAAGTDWADGDWARRWGPITKLGRVLDPLADKLLICGVFTYLAAIPDSQVAPWMAVVVLGRELLVTTLRAMVEGGGGDFSAKWIGKWKMVAQCVAAGLSLLTISAWAVPGLPASLVSFAVWLAVGLTLLSGWTYTRDAIAAMRS